MLAEIKIIEGKEVIMFVDTSMQICGLMLSRAPDCVSLGTYKECMVLDRGQVEALTEHLVNWLNTGSFKGD